MNYELIEKIEEQQRKYDKNTAVYAVGEQLKGICEKYAGAAELVLCDLQKPEMSIEACEKKIKEYADELHRTNKSNAICINTDAAEDIICRFYGIDKEASASGGVVSLTDLL